MSLTLGPVCPVIEPLQSKFLSELTTAVGVNVMNEQVKKSMVIRPFSSKRGFNLLIICMIAGFGFAAIALFISNIAPAGDPAAHRLIIVMIIMSVISETAGVVFFLVFPRVKILFDPERNEVIIKVSGKGMSAIPFSALQPFRIYEVLWGYAHQYYCRNASFGDYSDLFFSSTREKTVKRAQKIASLTKASLFDYDGREIF